jgi:hypothetical protein
MAGGGLVSGLDIGGNVAAVLRPADAAVRSGPDA